MFSTIMSDKRPLSLLSLSLFVAAALFPWPIASIGHPEPAIIFAGVALLLAFFFAVLSRSEYFSRVVLWTVGGGLGLIVVCLCVSVPLYLWNKSQVSQEAMRHALYTAEKAREALIRERQRVENEVPKPRISNVTIADKTATLTGIGGENQECVLRIAKSKRNKQLEWTAPANGQFTATVTASDQLPSDNGQMLKGIILTVQNSKSASTANIAMSEGDPVPAGTVRFREKSAIDRADTMVTIADILCDDGTAIPVSILLRDKVDRSNARTVVESYIAAALADDTQTATLLAMGTPAERKQIESLPKQLNVQRLVIKSVYVNDPARPTTALATSEAVKLTEKQPDGQRDGFLVLTLTMSAEDWLVTDIDFESEESAEDEMKRFREAHPSAVDLPPLNVDVLPGTDSGSNFAPQSTDQQVGDAP
jgi:hypothetical protein